MIVCTVESSLDDLSFGDRIFLPRSLIPTQNFIRYNRNTYTLESTLGHRPFIPDSFHMPGGVVAQRDSIVYLTVNLTLLSVITVLTVQSSPHM